MVLHVSELITISVPKRNLASFTSMTTRSVNGLDLSICELMPHCMDDGSSALDFIAATLKLMTCSVLFTISMKDCVVELSSSERRTAFINILQIFGSVVYVSLLSNYGSSHVLRLAIIMLTTVAILNQCNFVIYGSYGSSLLQLQRLFSSGINTSLTMLTPRASRPPTTKSWRFIN